jgi:CheY-like chemotaxis protein
VVSESLSILVVEDEALIAWHLENQLTRLGHRVCSIAATEAEAIAAEEQHRPDLVLMDLRLAAGGSGLIAAEAIRRRRLVPILFCTAHTGDPEFLTRVKAMPHSAVVGKPVDEAAIKKASEVLLKRSRT